MFIGAAAFNQDIGTSSTSGTWDTSAVTDICPVSVRYADCNECFERIDSDARETRSEPFQQVLFVFGIPLLYVAVGFLSEFAYGRVPIWGLFRPVCAGTPRLLGGTASGSPW